MRNIYHPLTFKDIYVDCEPEAKVVVEVAGDLEPKDWPAWLRIAWNKPQGTLCSVSLAAVADDFWLNVIDSEGNVQEVREGDSLAWNEPEVYVIPKS